MNKRQLVFEKTNGKCWYCGCDIDFNYFHIDHMMPKKMLKQDINNISNLFPCCADCNLSKGDMTLEEFRNKIENIFDKRHFGRIIKKYYNIKPTKIIFYFEKENQKGQ